MLESARTHHGASLLLRGDAGIGKTTLLHYAVSVADGLRVIEARVVEAERDLPYAGLSLILTPCLDGLDALVPAQRRALETALRLRAPGRIDRFTVFAGALSLLAAAADQQPVLVTLDDAHWLDSSSSAALVYLARRLANDAVALLVASRDALPIPECVVGPLDTSAAAEALGDVAPAVAERLCDATGGNPLALVEAARTLTSRQRAGTEPLPDPLSVGDDLFDRQIAALPDAARRALTIAATDDRVAVVTLAAALATCGLTLADLEPAETSELLKVRDDGVAFHHPLVRAAAYHRATPPERRAAHLALATALSACTHRSRRAWHLAAAATGPDDQTADELQAIATDARGSGAPAAAARALESAARLTTDPERRVERLLLAAEDHLLCGSVEAMASVLDEALVDATTDLLTRARIEHLRNRGAALDGAPLAGAARLREEAARVRLHDAELSRAMLVDAAILHVMGGEPVEALRVLRPLEPSAASTVPLAMCEVLAGDHARGVELLDELAPMLAADGLRAGHLAPAAAQGLLFRGEGLRARTAMERLVARIHGEGLFGQLPYALTVLAETEFVLGAWAASRAHALQSLEIAEAAGGNIPQALTMAARIEAGLGHTDAARRHGERALAMADRYDIGAIRTVAGHAMGFLELGLGRFEAAIAFLQPTGEFTMARGVHHPLTTPWAQDLIEAYVRSGRSAEAAEPMAELEYQVARTDDPLTRSALHRCRGLLEEDVDQLEQSLALHAGLTVPFERARTEFCLGERLRREGHRTDARAHLTAALLGFERLGAEPWAVWARRELVATGQTARRRQPATADELTPQELQVAVIVAGGATNKEAAAQLFVSPKTIETHLLRTYRKLGIRSRKGLTEQLRVGQDQ